MDAESKAKEVHMEILEMRRRMAHEEVVRKQLAVAWDYVAYLREGGERAVVTNTAHEIMADLREICAELDSPSCRHSLTHADESSKDVSPQEMNPGPSPTPNAVPHA